MNFYIGYFQQIKSMSDNILPISTAIWQPKWLPKDKYVVMEELSPRYINHHSDCKGCTKDKYLSCEFLKEYKEYIYSLNIRNILNKINTLLFMTDYIDVCFMVYELPDNPCSERHILKKWFEDNGIPIRDFKM